MTYELTESIREAIKKNLPATVGDELRKRLEMIDQLESRNDGLQSLTNRLNADLAELRTTLEKHKALDLREAALLKRQENITEREVRIESTIAENNACEARKRSDDIFRLAEIALGKRSRTETVERHGHKDHPGESGYSNSSLSHNETVTRTVEETG